jgi:hypothetical protein
MTCSPSNGVSQKVSFTTVWMALAREAGEHERDAGGEGRQVTPHPHDKQNVGPPSRPGW